MGLHPPGRDGRNEALCRECHETARSGSPVFKSGGRYQHISVLPMQRGPGWLQKLLGQAGSLCLTSGAESGPDSVLVGMLSCRVSVTGSCEAGGGVWTLTNKTKYHHLCFTQKNPSFCLYLKLIGKVSAGLKIGLSSEKDFCGTVEESEACATYTQSFCAWKANSVVII